MIDIAQHVHRGRSGHITESVTHVMCKKPDARGTCVATIANVVPAARIMSHDVVCARADLATDALIELMVRNHIGCVPVNSSTPRGASYPRLFGARSKPESHSCGSSHPRTSRPAVRIRCSVTCSVGSEQAGRWSLR